MLTFVCLVILTCPLIYIHMHYASSISTYFYATLPLFRDMYICIYVSRDATRAGWAGGCNSGSTREKKFEFRVSPTRIETRYIQPELNRNAFFSGSGWARIRVGLYGFGLGPEYICYLAPRFLTITFTPIVITVGVPNPIGKKLAKLWKQHTALVR